MYLRDGKVGQTFKEPRSGRYVVVESIEDGEAKFRYTAGTNVDSELGEVFPMGDWEPVEVPTILDTPWGPPQHTSMVAEGMVRVVTASHGGLRLLTEAQERLPQEVRDSLLNGPQWAEEDCEEIIVLALLRQTNERETLIALKMAQQIDRYRPAVPHLEELAGVEVVEPMRRDRITVSGTASEEVQRRARQTAEQMGVAFAVESDPLRNSGQYAHADGRTEYSD